MEPKYKTVLLDMYGVIIKESHGNFKDFLSVRKPEISKDLYITNYIAASRGKMEYNDFMSIFGFTEPVSGGRDYVENYLTFDPDFIGFAKMCKSSGISLALLSNDISEWSGYIREYCKIEKYFDFCVVSGDIGLRKPDAAIFRTALNKLKCKPDECVYVDDNIRNLDVAEDLGCKTILFCRDNSCHGKAWWHRGYMSEALSGVIDFFFSEIGINHVESQHDPNNPHSGGVMKKCGMKYEGTARQADYSNKGIVDACKYAILREDWLAEHR